jgi:cytidylate kinase
VTRALTIAIDGPVASGKSTLGAALAERLGYTYFDSGVIYRAITWLALRRGLAVTDEDGLVEAVRTAEISVMRPAHADGRQFTVTIDGQDATWGIRSPEVDHNVSAVAAQPGVRRAANERLRQIASTGGIVMVGRDIGTVVLPDADLKVYLTASDQERARRRHRELQARGLTANYDEILAGLRRRDALDSGRETAPLRPAPDAIRLDSDNLTVAEEVEIVLRHVAASAGVR